MARRATALVLTDVPIGAWTVAITFDVLDLIRSRREFALAADTSIAIGSGTVDNTGTMLKLNYIINGSPSGSCEIDDGTGTMAKL